MRLRAGAAQRDITPPAGLAMAGFGARTAPATGAHDPLSVRALVIEDTALLVADVIGIEAAMAARIRARCALPAENVVIAALHTHGGPGSMRARMRVAADAAWLDRLETACITALDAAAAAARPADLSFAAGTDPGLASNRRHAGGPVDRLLPCLRLRGTDGAWIAVLASWACHPVVLGPDNLRWTADHPHFLRAALEAAHPGAVAIAATGCCGDVNTGHSAQASLSGAPAAERSFARARALGEGIAAAILAAPAAPVGGECVAAAEEWCALPFAPPDAAANAATLAQWRAAREGAGEAERALLDIWIGWAETTARQRPEPLHARVSGLRWGDVQLLALPGEIFAQTALDLRARAGPAGARAFLLGYAEDNPGYICPADEAPHGGYEVDQAHRYYDMPAPFAPGCAEALAKAAARVLARLDGRRGNGMP